MFRLINSHLQNYSLQVKSQDVVYTFGSPTRVKLAKYVTNWLK